jgi:hypothetical protein
MPDLPIAEKLVLWNELVSSLAADLDRMPHLGEAHGELKAAVAEIAALDVEAARLTARLREITALRNAAERRGSDANGRLVAGLRSRLGKHSEELLRYGVQPVPRRRRSRGAPAAG